MKPKNSENTITAGRLVGLIFLAVLWIGLAAYILIASGVNLKNILLVTMSGIIIFYPLYKKYWAGVRN